MALTDADECCHEPGPESNWQENYFFLGWDDASASGYYLHLVHEPVEGTVTTKALVSTAGRVVSTETVHRAESALSAPGLTAEVIEPYRVWRLRWAGTGTANTIDDPWYAENGGDEPFGFEVELRTQLPPADWRDAGRALGIPDEILTDHYESGAVQQGHLVLGGTRTPIGGLSIRDHSWGPRDFHGIEIGLWCPMVLTDATAMVSGMSILRDGRWQGFLLHCDESGVEISLDPWIRLNGFPEPRGYRGASVLDVQRGLRYDLTETLSVPARHPSMGKDHLMNDMFGTVTIGDRRGFGVIELNRH